MVKRVRATRTLLIGAGVTLAGMLLAAGPASAAPSLPQPTVLDGGDSYLNGTEITAVQVQGSYGTGIERVKVRVVPSATCDPNATPTLSQTLLVTPGPGTYTATFDLSDATQIANNVAIFPEGSAICAIARAGTFDVVEGDYVYGAASFSTNQPVKDTVVLAGSVSIIDPVSPDWLNNLESIATPNVGFPMGSIKGAWAKNASSDAIGAQVFWANATTLAAVSSDCGPFPATISYTPSSFSNGGTQADQPLAKLCADAPNFAEGDEISFNARWTDVAGNISPVATTAAFPDGNLKKDTIAPAVPTVDLLGASTSWNPPLKSAPADAVLSSDVINGDNVSDVDVNVGYTDGDIDYIDVSVTDSTLIITQRRDALDNPQLFDGFDLRTLKNCGTGVTAGTNNPPTHTQHPSLGVPPVFPGECITATAKSTDLAGNISLPASDLAFKDARDPLAPNVVWFPSTIADANDNLTELEVTGEPYSVVSVNVTDEDPSSTNLTNGDGGTLTKFRLDDTGFGAIDLDVTTMSDGTILATVGLIDPWGNAGPEVVKSATKNLTTPSLVLTSPAAGSMNARTVSFSGIAKYNNIACAGCRITIYDHPSNVPNYGNPANVALVTVVSDATGRFNANYTYNNSGVKRTFFRATDLSNPANPINGRPSAVRAFSVDVRIPQVAFTSPGGTFLPGDSVVVRGNATDDFSGLAGVELIITRLSPVYGVSQALGGRPGQFNETVGVAQGDQTNCSTCPGGLTGTWSYDLSTLPAGRYTVTAYAFDMAGQRSFEAVQSFNKLG